MLFCFFTGQETSELVEVAFYQRGVSHEVATLHTWVEVMIKTGGGKNIDTAFDGDSLHAL